MPGPARGGESAAKDPPSDGIRRGNGADRKGPVIAPALALALVAGLLVGTVGAARPTFEVVFERSDSSDLVVTLSIWHVGNYTLPPGGSVALLLPDGVYHYNYTDLRWSVGGACSTLLTSGVVFVSGSGKTVLLNAAQCDPGPVSTSLEWTIGVGFAYSAGVVALVALARRE